MRSLIKVEVKGLLGRFDHTVTIPRDWDFAILHGPNGVGKTKILELIRDALTLNAARISVTPFDSASFVFSDDSILRVSRETNHSQASDGVTRGERRPVTYRLTQRGAQEAVWATSSQHKRRSRRPGIELLEDLAPLQRLPGRPSNRGMNWMDLVTGEVLSINEALDRYGYLVGRFDAREFKDEEIPEAIIDFCNSFHVHLIETQRLLAVDSGHSRTRPQHDEPGRPTVVRYASHLRDQLQTTLATNSRTSQLLDRSFPKRVLERQLDESVSDELIRDRYEEQTALRARLGEIALMDAQPDLPLPKRTLEAWETRVLWTFLEDTEKKLATFKPLLARLDVLRDIVKSRFLFKELQIDTERGFKIVSDDGREVPAESLSSGEQHELVLAYDLLFNAPQGSLVLIDEPEISLHIGWQKNFLNDVQRIADVAELRFLIATHSPQIINKSWNRTVSLKAGGAIDRDFLEPDSHGGRTDNQGA